jgi:carboxymethylenebutenolidase
MRTPTPRAAHEAESHDFEDVDLMRRKSRRIALTLAAALVVASCREQPPVREVALTGRVVEYGRTPSGAALRGVLYLPQGQGQGPFPVVLYAHGSAPGSLSNEAFEAVAPAFTAHGWALFAPYRRGQGLSAAAGPFIRDQVAAARTEGGGDRAQQRLAELLAGVQMEDQASAFAWLARQPFADPRRIAAMGNSFGGVIALLSAERLPVCAAVDASGGAESWAEAPALRRLMTAAAMRARPPLLFIQAANDHDLAPSRILDAQRMRAGLPTEFRLYPPFGRGPAEGHAFAWRGAALWGADVRGFLARHCRAGAADDAARMRP